MYIYPKKTWFIINVYYSYLLVLPSSSHRRSAPAMQELGPRRGQLGLRRPLRLCAGESGEARAAGQLSLAGKIGEIPGWSHGPP